MTTERTFIKSFTVTIPEGQAVNKKGDINNDGFINNKDIVALFRYVSSGNTNETERYDYNGDGEANNKDVTVLFRFISSFSA